MSYKEKGKYMRGKEETYGCPVEDLNWRLFLIFISAVASNVESIKIFLVPSLIKTCYLLRMIGELRPKISKRGQHAELIHKFASE